MTVQYVRDALPGAGAGDSRNAGIPSPPGTSSAGTSPPGTAPAGTTSPGSASPGSASPGWASPECASPAASSPGSASARTTPGGTTPGGESAPAGPASLAGASLPPRLPAPPLAELAAAETRETHSAVLYLTADRVYKRKKPVNLGFLDFSERRTREAVCLAEVALNRRLAPDVYLGVADLRDGSGEVIDHLVVMRRMPTSRRLSTLVRRGHLLGPVLRSVARALAVFHQRCETSPLIASAGERATLEDLWREGMAGIAAYRGTQLDAAVVDDIGRLALRYLAGRAELLAERTRAGWIRDGHGDLLADDIFCLDDGPRILDCIEFDPRLRFGDVLGDVAFLAMDLERLGAPEEAAEFLEAYREFSGEVHPRSLQHFYVAYRAFVRAKVACIRGGQGDPDAAENARRLLAVAHRHLRAGRVRLVVVGGLPGTGKTTLASRLAEVGDGWVLLRSDIIRQELVGQPPAEAPPQQTAEAAAPPASGAATGFDAQFGVGRYAPEITDATYAEMLRRARAALCRGESVVLDASWSSSSHRDAAATLAADVCADLVELLCVTAPEVAAARIARRMAAGPDASEATVAIHRAMAARADPWPSAAVIRTAVTVAEALQAVQSHLD
ncbi:AAA family ATPase [Frankia sp. AiPs1]|uniref:bifunctional aminoglycoside phosphotransferase/ATP-binding protein n=1 Tax=Frankia sp. AiPs1 TaxID=573493 RepID=UPI0020447AC7|nr:AAA family ATPase [Frankia sp. AiPs1]MCM3923188.1 AAA family ATPase [Frankia sp. AiPs1]